VRMRIRCRKHPPPTSWLHRVGASRFKHVDGQEAEWALRVTIAKDGVWKIGPILQGLAGSILSGIIAAISRLGNAFHDVDRSPNGMPMKRSYATGRISHLNHDQLPDIAGQWKTFENLTRDARKPGLLSAELLGSRHRPASAASSKLSRGAMKRAIARRVDPDVTLVEKTIPRF
jgi:hypothetical protein